MVCKNEMGAAWALKGKRTLPFILPNHLSKWDF